MSNNKNEVDAPEVEESRVEEIDGVVKEKSNFPILAIFVVISLLLSITAAVGLGVSWFKNEQQQLIQTQSVQSLKNKQESLQQAQQVNKNVSTAMEASLNKQQQDIAKQLSQITEKLGRNQHDWAVAEIRYTLRQANMRLQLFKDKTTALVALQIADTQLAKLADPALYKMRGVVNKEIAALRAVKEIDIEGVSLKLSALASQVTKLDVSITGRSKASNPANIPSVSSASDLAAWQKHADAIWSELKTLVTIRRTDKKILPLLSEQESQQLRQALGLKIEITRLALLQQNTSLFRASLKAANDWLEVYFNAEQPAVMAITKELKSLMSLQLEPEYPDISGSLAMLGKPAVVKAKNVTTIVKDKDKNRPKVKKPTLKKPPSNKEKSVQ